MPKIRHIDTKGLVQESGAGVTFEQGQITKTLSHVTDTLTLVADGAAIVTASAENNLPAGCRVLAYKVEVVEAGAADSAISKIGHDGDDDAFVADAGLNNNTAGSNAGFSASETTVLSAAQKLQVTHAAIANAAGNSGKVRVTALIEQVS